MYFGFLDVVYVEVEWTTGVFVKKAEVVIMRSSRCRDCQIRRYKCEL